MKKTLNELKKEVDTNISLAKKTREITVFTIKDEYYAEDDGVGFGFHQLKPVYKDLVHILVGKYKNKISFEPGSAKREVHIKVTM